MAVTKMMNIKSGKSTRGAHLYNAIEYILKPKKTESVEWIGGNCGNETKEVYDTFLQTKKDWDKPDGRQGYHYILSWKSGEIDRETAYQIVKEFCEEYLGDDYDYVFAMHNDRKHMHGHIIFNSVNRTSGYKYRYERGDWEKCIQPVTDKLCEKYGIPPLRYEKENRIGKSYAQWYAEKNKQPTWKKIIQSDVDNAAAKAVDETDFLKRMKEMEYEVRKGKSKKHGVYYSFLAPGQRRAWRSYNLGAGYSFSDIREKIQNTRFDYHYPKPPRLRQCRIRTPSPETAVSNFQKRYLRKIFIITHRQRAVKNPYEINQREIRKSLLHIQSLHEDCVYLLQKNIRSYDALIRREEKVLQEERQLKNQLYRTELLEGDETAARYFQLRRQLMQLRNEQDDFELVLDEMEELEEKLPDYLFEEEKLTERTKDSLARIRNEKRIIRHIKREEQKALSQPVRKKEKNTDRKIKEERKELWQTM